jgi:hypothetical protein
MARFEPRQFHGRTWTPAQLRRLEKLLERGTALAIAALKLGRTQSAVRKKAMQLRSGGSADRRPSRGAAPRVSRRR